MSQFDKLIKSVKKGQIQKASEIMQEATLNINDLDPKSGKTLLQLSIENQTLQIFNMLVGYPGINVQQASKDGQLPLETAVTLNSIYFVTKLLQTGNINPKRTNQNQQTVLEVAIRNQTLSQIIKKLIQYKFDINQSVQRYGSLINLAIQNNQIDNMMFLLGLGGKNDKGHTKIKIEVTDHQDNTCLMLAVKGGKGDAVLAILQHLAQENCHLNDLEKQFLINSQNKQSNTALHIACLKNHQTIISLLQTRGTAFGLDLTLRNKKGLTSEDIKTETVKQRILQAEMKQKNQQEKRIYLKQKEQQKQRLKDEEERSKIEQKRKKKEEELLLMKQQQYEKQLTHSKMKWICGIAIILIVGVMYLLMLNAIGQKKADQF